MIKDFEKKAKAYALKNALAHEGKAQQGAVISALFNEGLKKEEIPKHIKQISEITNEINKLSQAQQEKEYLGLQDLISERESREGLPELPNVPKTGVVMRYRPGPSGPLHIGHAMSNVVNSLYVKKYGGKFYVIIDDTDPSTCLIEAYTNIKTDCDWLFGNVFKYLNASDRMEIYYSYVEKLIKKNAAYVCTCDSEKFKEFVDKKENCPCRDYNKEENLVRWKKMLDNSGFNEGEAVLRFKSDMNNPNPAMRDFPLARINKHEHAIQKNKYRVWPLMNLSVTVDDIELGMTHVIRGKDHMDNAKRQKMIFEVLGKGDKFPWTYFMGRIKFTDLELSKRKIKAKIDSGEYEGFEDKKLPTLASLRKRGYTPEAFAKLAEQRGLTEVDKVMESKDLMNLLDEFNK
jgi:glutamyl-tRNA synthetase